MKTTPVVVVAMALTCANLMFAPVAAQTNHQVALNMPVETSSTEGDAMSPTVLKRERLPADEVTNEHDAILGIHNTVWEKVLDVFGSIIVACITSSKCW